MNRRNRRGFTLTELVIVLAVLAIVSTMVISFTAMVTNSRQLSSARLDALGDGGTTGTGGDLYPVLVQELQDLADLSLNPPKRAVIKDLLT